MKFCPSETGEHFNPEQSAPCFQECPCDAFWGIHLSNIDYLLSTCCIQALGQDQLHSSEDPSPCRGARSQLQGDAAPHSAGARGAPLHPNPAGLGFPGWADYLVPVLRTTPASAYKPRLLCGGRELCITRKKLGNVSRLGRKASSQVKRLHLREERSRRSQPAGEGRITQGVRAWDCLGSILALPLRRYVTLSKYLASLRICFPVCKMGLIIMPTS